MKMDVAAMRVSRELVALEESVDRAIAATGATLTELANVRIATGTPAVTGQRAFARLAEAQAKFVAARGDIARAHEDLRQVVKADFPSGDCPPTAIDTDADFARAA